MLPTCFPQLPTPHTKKWVHVMVSISSLGPAVQPQVWISPVQIHYLARFLTVTDLILYLGKSFPDSVQFLFFVLFSKYSLEYAIFYMQAVLTDTGCAHGKDFTCYLSRQRPSGIELYNILKTFDFKINPRSWCNFLFWYYPPGSAFLIASFAPVRQSKTAARLVVRAPLTVHITPIFRQPR